MNETLALFERLNELAAYFTCAPAGTSLPPQQSGTEAAAFPAQQQTGAAAFETAQSLVRRTAPENAAEERIARAQAQPYATAEAAARPAVAAPSAESVRESFSTGAAAAAGGEETLAAALSRAFERDARRYV